MPLVLRALPLSFLTLWHYVFWLPLVLIICIPFLLLALIPFVGLLVMTAIATFISFGGFRAALAALGRDNEPAFGKLIGSSMLLSVINTLVSIMFLVVSIGVGMAAEYLGLFSGFTAPGMEEIPYATGIGVLVYIGLTSLYYCAMAVPMTALAAAATPKGRDPGPFYGFGAGLISVGLAWVLWIAGLVLLGFFLAITEGVGLGMQTAVSSLIGMPLADPIAVDWWFFGLSVVYALWGTCWFCATAALAWDRTQERHAAAAAPEIEAAPRMSTDDLRALREARMPGRGDQG